MRSAECDAGGGRVERCDFRGCRFVAVADSDHCLHGSVWRRDRNPVYVADFTCGAAQILIFADDEAVGGAVERDDVERAAGSDADSLSLADCVLMQARVAAENFAAGGDDFAGIIWQMTSLLL